MNLYVSELFRKQRYIMDEGYECLGVFYRFPNHLTPQQNVGRIMDRRRKTSVR